MGKKCCTKKPNCDNTPQCLKEFDYNQILAYLTTFNLLIVIFRVLLIKKEEAATIDKGVIGHLWWYTKFIFFLEIQLFSIVCFVRLTMSTYESLKTCLLQLLAAIKDFLGLVTPNPFMDWLGLTETYWWLNKIWCFIVIIWFITGFFVILGGYLFVVLLFGPYLLGYYKINAYKARGDSYF